MMYGWRLRHHRAASCREESAGARATCIESARAHYLLADLHRHEAAKIDAIRTSLNIAFSD